ncbi:glycosyltransferase [Solwaraspora sp. WMMB335]|uniref:glycosyltransferase n=1 Tax=Solwaraspora sp. WMMB335 TaxID=3404118 RepID=UPI003B93138D
MRRRRVLVFTIPNEGHLNILKRLIRAHRAEHTFRLVLVDRQTVGPRLGDLAGLAVGVRGSGQFLNTPADRVFERAYRLLDECLAAARAFGPDLVLYDFCAVEGHLVARLLGVPGWSSVPGLVGSLVDTGYLRSCLTAPANAAAIEKMNRRYAVDLAPSAVELVSNSLHLPGDRNLLWSYPAVTPVDFRTNRAPADYRFAGYLSDGWQRTGGRQLPAGWRRRGDRPPAVPVVYLSFGTEVLDNLWYADPRVAPALRRCVAGLARRWNTTALSVVFPTRGRHILDRYPDNWAVGETVDQQQTLSRADAFVTHGGANSFHEAILAQVPMVVVPFFGDQPLVARQAQRLGIGIGLGRRVGIDRGVVGHRLPDDGCADRIADAVARLLDDGSYRANLAALPLAADPPLVFGGQPVLARSILTRPPSPGRTPLGRSSTPR